jgi:hypothetical protein
MTKKCANRGCKKYARGGIWCAYHQHTCGNRRASRRASRTMTTTIPPSPSASKRRAFFKKFTISDESFLEIQSLINRILELEDTDLLERGRRRLFDIDDEDRQELEPLLLSIVSLAKTEIGFPLQTWKVQKPNIVVAPGCSGLSNSWTKGSLHRDFWEEEKTTGVYSFLLFLDEVTTANGTVEFWPNSQCLPLDRKNPERAISKSGLTAELTVGPSATVYAWDSRILHRSLPNTTKNRRLTLAWLVTAQNGPTIEYA